MKSAPSSHQQTPSPPERRSIVQWAVFLIVALLFLGVPASLIYNDFFHAPTRESDLIPGPPKPVATGTTRPATQPTWRTTLARLQPRRFPSTNAVPQPPLLRAMAMANYDSALAMIDQGANVNVVSTDGRLTTPLIEACTRPEDEAFDVIQVLLGKGADVNHRQAMGVTALMRAVRSHSPQTMALLLAHEAEVNAVTQRGQTALDMATQVGDADLIATLQKAGGKPGSVFAPRPRPATRPATRPTSRPRPTTRPTTRSRPTTRATTRPTA